MSGIVLNRKEKQLRKRDAAVLEPLPLRAVELFRPFFRCREKAASVKRDALAAGTELDSLFRQRVLQFRAEGYQEMSFLSHGWILIKKTPISIYVPELIYEKYVPLVLAFLHSVRIKL